MKLRYDLCEYFVIFFILINMQMGGEKLYIFKIKHSKWEVKIIF